MGLKSNEDGFVDIEQLGELAVPTIDSDDPIRDFHILCTYESVIILNIKARSLEEALLKAESASEEIDPDRDCEGNGFRFEELHEGNTP